MKLLIILEGGDAYPSGITRGYIYKSLLKDSRIRFKFVNKNSPFLLKKITHPGILSKLFNPRLISSFAARINFYYSKVLHHYILFISVYYDIVYTSKLQDYDLIYKLKNEKSRKIIYDFGDSVWLYKNSNRFNEVLALVDVVTTDNEYVLKHVLKFNSNCHVIPDYPQLEIFDKVRERFRKKNDKIIIGWIGSPNTLFNINLIWDVLHYLFTRYNNIHLRFIGVGDNKNIFPDYNYIDYSVRKVYNQSQMAEEILKMDIGLFPLQDIEASRVRGILKATIYMSGGVPVVASRIGELNDFIKEGENGFLAGNSEEWRSNLELLINDESLRNRVGQNGLQTVRKAFSVEENFKKLITIFNTLV